MSYFAHDASTVFIRNLWRRMTRVDSSDPLRCALNRALAAVLVPLIAVDLVFIVTMSLSGESLKAMLGVASLPVHLVALWLNRRGTTYGAWLETLLLVFVSVVGVATFGPLLVEGSIPLALVLPAVAATLFIRPSAGLAVLPLELGALAVALAVIGVPWERALPFLATALIALTTVVIFLVAGASIVWSALRRYVDANERLQSEVAERRRAEQRLRYLAHHDVLTSLPNRTLLRDHLHLAMREAARDSRMVAVLLLDVDRFKTINDSLGHAVGDQLLIAIGKRLTEAVRTGGTVARVGGDEYALVLPGIERTDDILPLVRKVHDCFTHAFEIGDHTLYATGSVGIALHPIDGSNADELLRNADVAMYRAKELGQNSHHFYAAEMTARAQQRLALEHELRSAVERDEFVLHYQPVVELRTRAIIAAEALVRWHHPRDGLTMPSRFISAAEDSGLILPISEWVLRTACSQCSVCAASGAPPVRIALNLSAHQFQRRATVDHLARILQGCAAPAMITLEITESTLMHPEAHTAQALHRLLELGVRIAVDDFGTGYSSLAYLKRFPVSVLKIDRSFVNGIGRDASDEAIVTAVIAMAKGLRVQVVAEGVETEEQLRFLEQQGCDAVQGFLFHPPLAASEFMSLLRENAHHAMPIQEHRIT